MTNSKLWIAPIGLALVACGDMLTETPKSFPTTDNFYKTPADIRSATLAAYQPLNTGDLYNWWLWLTTDLASDQVRMNPDEPNFGTYHPEFLLWDATNSSVTAEWNGFYNIIFRANLVLGRAPNVPFPDETERVRLLAEAKFLRGYSYFMLAKLYGEPGVSASAKRVRSSAVGRRVRKRRNTESTSASDDFASMANCARPLSAETRVIHELMRLLASTAG